LPTSENLFNITLIKAESCYISPRFNI